MDGQYPCHKGPSSLPLADGLHPTALPQRLRRALPSLASDALDLKARPLAGGNAFQNETAVLRMKGGIGCSAPLLLVFDMADMNIRHGIRQGKAPCMLVEEVMTMQTCLRSTCPGPTPGSGSVKTRSRCRWGRSAADPHGQTGRAPATRVCGHVRWYLLLRIFWARYRAQRERSGRAS
jgi:hypothetical protein